MKFKVYISQVWTYTTEIEADSRAEADEKEAEIAEEVHPGDGEMHFGDEYIEVERIKQ